ncbi:hypothetical protein [Candidatus Entotheonella palauensis]|uniref:hypothetical protein n=1 Tax=Candidatus Entotheonella palauensis TaxID=93172 RepID=UPI000B7E3D6C|nr:hypothetical protein [Candidatus Entotheonella palauensis]
MERSLVHHINTLLSYPFTRGALLLILAVHVAFGQWFQPSFGLHIAAFAIDASAFAFWLRLATTSADFQSFSDTQLSKRIATWLRQQIRGCHPDFQPPVLACIDLAQQIQRDFDRDLLHGDMHRLFENLEQVTRNHLQLYDRSKTFGTDAQQADMTRLLAKQASSMQQTLETLRAFSGHLTLLAVSLEREEMAAKELQLINQGLEEIIEEINHETL